MQQCCHLSTYIVPFHTRKVNRNFTKKRGAESQRFRRILGDFDKKAYGGSEAHPSAHIERMFVLWCISGTYVRNKCSLWIQNVCSLCPNIRSCSGCPVSEQMFGVVSNKRSFLVRTNVLSLLEQTFDFLANKCSFTKEHLFAAGQTKSPSRRRGDFIQFDVITE